MIHVNDLRKTYPDLEHGEFVAVDGISFEAYPGEVFGLLGPNGAGKTTTLRVLSTVLQPNAGTARIAGYDLVTQPDLVRRKIGFMSASTGVYERMTAWEMVEFFGQLYEIPADRLKARMEEIFALLKMNDFRDVVCAKMSTGMKQKVSIARCIVHDPDVLILDEATSGLDVLVARSLLDSVLELKDQGKCILYSTHIMREAERLCDRIAIIHRGKMLANGTLDELRDEHQYQDLEELFYQLVSRCEEEATEAAKTA